MKAWQIEKKRLRVMFLSRWQGLIDRGMPVEMAYYRINMSLPEWSRISIRTFYRWRRDEMPERAKDNNKDKTQRL